MGHIRLAGKVREVEMFGTRMLEVTVPDVDDVKGFTTFRSGASLFAVTPTTEEIAKGVVRAQRPRPVQPYDLDLGKRSLGPVTDADEIDRDSNEIDEEPTW
jgi:hypothetical protein